MKRVISAFCALGLSVSMIFAGCGSSANTATSSSSSAKAEVVEAESSSSESNEKEEVKETSEKTEATDTTSISTTNLTPTEAAEKKQRNGFDGGTNNYTLYNLTISIPSCYGDPVANDNNVSTWWPESNYAAFQLSSTDAASENLTSEAFENGGKIEFCDSAMDAFKSSFPGISSDSIYEEGDVTIGGYSGYQCKAKSSNDGTIMCIAVAYLSDQNIMVSFNSYESPESQYSYTDDFDKILENITATDTSSASTSSSSTTDSGEVTPELKEFLDSYEELMDQYVELAKEYAANPTDATLLAKYSKILSQYADFSKKAEEYQQNESSMSTADYNYYVDTMADVEKKLVEAEGYLSGTGTQQ